MHITPIRLPRGLRRALFGLGIAVLALAGATVAIAADTHVVGPGETLGTIAEEHGVTVQQLMEWNGLTNPDLVFAGQQLVVTAPPPPPPPPPPPEPKHHEVQPGETLSMIADQYGTTVAVLVEANAITDPDHIRIGAILTIPDPAAPPAAKPTPTASVPAAPALPPQRRHRFYVIEAGDTIAVIAGKFGTTIDLVVAANGLVDRDQIAVGQVLRIPARDERPAPPPASKAQAKNALQMAAFEFAIPVDLLMALAWQESGWQQHLVSDAGAVGLMQILPETAEWTVDALMRDSPDWYNSVDGNARVGAAHFRHLLVLSGGDESLAVAAYYQGWEALNTIGIYQETKVYVANVMALRPEFK
jgi:LysM repeat protein